MTIYFDINCHNLDLYSWQDYRFELTTYLNLLPGPGLARLCHDYRSSWQLALIPTVMSRPRIAGLCHGYKYFLTTCFDTICHNLDPQGYATIIDLTNNLLWYQLSGGPGLGPAELCHNYRFSWQPVLIPFVKTWTLDLQGFAMIIGLTNNMLWYQLLGFGHAIVPRL